MFSYKPLLIQNVHDSYRASEYIPSVATNQSVSVFIIHNISISVCREGCMEKVILRPFPGHNFLKCYYTNLN